MSKWCRTCGRKRHKGLCDMVELTNGRVVHSKRVDLGGDLHEELGETLKVKNRWIKPDLLKKNKKAVAEGNVADESTA